MLNKAAIKAIQYLDLLHSCGNISALDYAIRTDRITERFLSC